MATKQVSPAKLAIDGGAAVREKENPLPSIFPRPIALGARENIERVLESGFSLDIIGEYEEAFAAAMGVNHAVALSNCTDALHAVLAAIGLASRGRGRGQPDNGLRIREGDIRARGDCRISRRRYPHWSGNGRGDRKGSHRTYQSHNRRAHVGARLRP